MVGLMKKKNRKEWFDKIARKSHSLGSYMVSYDPQQKNGASEEEIVRELKNRGVQSVRFYSAFFDVFTPFKPGENEQPLTEACS
jgi:hypothetical protein